ncbi:MAG TPA: FAD:protein FMN transferase, partial [Solirubrobacteraceae bacterium]|nr:FAD:protein FMN transferase [Solirubrobacteraceae bacterium]
MRAARCASGRTARSTRTARSPEVRDRPGGGGHPEAVEPAGYVKGWAAAGAWRRLTGAGARNAMVDAGGDLLVRGRPSPTTRWRVGIAHPDGDALAAVLEL